jgi:hypothetical protein
LRPGLRIEDLIMRVLVVAMLLAALTGGAVPAAADPSVIHVPGVSSPWPGKIFVAHDEWGISDYGYELARPSARQLTLNLATWFTGGRPGRFLVYSSFYGLVGHEIAATMTGAGHRWTVDATVPFTLDTLLGYDAVFVGGTEADNSVLIDYVRAGGNVYIEGGTGLGGDIVEARHWNTFLKAFGLAFGDRYDLGRPAGVYPVVSTSPLFAGVSQLYEQTGNPVLKLDAGDPNVQIAVPYDGHALYATYDARVVPVALEVCDRLSAQSNGALWVSIVGTPDVDVRTVDLDSVRVLSVKPFVSTYTFVADVSPGLARRVPARRRPPARRRLRLPQPRRRPRGRGGPGPLSRRR